MSWDVMIFNTRGKAPPPLKQSIGSAIDDLLLIAEYMPVAEIRDQVVGFLPFRG